MSSMAEVFQELATLQVEFVEFVAYVTLNRPETRNAMNAQMVAELTQLFHSLRNNRDIRAIVLSGSEGFFCAGGDIKEMRERGMPAAEDANNLDAMLRACNESPQIVIARIEGAALGGGLGLVCVSDVAIASTTAKFGLTEVRLGVAPSFISPYVLQRIGLTRSRELMLTGRRFDGKTALEYGLVHTAVPPEEMDHAIEMELDEIRKCAPGAIAAIKQLIFTVYGKSPQETVEYRANLLNHLRQGEEAQEGLSAFLEKRSPKWMQGGKADD